MPYSLDGQLAAHLLALSDDMSLLHWLFRKRGIQIQKSFKVTQLLEIDTRVGWRLVKFGVIVVLSQILLVSSFITGKLAIPNSDYITIFLNGLVMTNQLENIFPMKRKVSSKLAGDNRV